MFLNGKINGFLLLSITGFSKLAAHDKLGIPKLVPQRILARRVRQPSLKPFHRLIFYQNKTNENSLSSCASQQLLFAELCEIVEEAMSLYRADEKPFPPLTAGRDFVDKTHDAA